MADAVGPRRRPVPRRGQAEGFRNFPDSATTKAPRISTVYTRGTLTLARLGREAPIAAASPERPGAARRRATAASPRAGSIPADRPGRSPIIGTDSPVQYEATDADPSAV